MSHPRRVRRLAKKKAKKMGTKRYLRILEDLPVRGIDGETPLKDDEGESVTCSHALFVAHRTADPAFAGADFAAEPPKQPLWSMKAIVSAETVRALVRGAKPGAVVEMDEDDWERLKRATEKGTYSAMTAGSLIPFMRAICDATLTKPEDVTASK